MITLIQNTFESCVKELCKEFPIGQEHPMLVIRPTEEFSKRHPGSLALLKTMGNERVQSIMTIFPERFIDLIKGWNTDAIHKMIANTACHEMAHYLNAVRTIHTKGHTAWWKEKEQCSDRGHNAQWRNIMEDEMGADSSVEFKYFYCFPTVLEEYCQSAEAPFNR